MSKIILPWRSFKIVERARAEQAKRDSIKQIVICIIMVIVLFTVITKTEGIW